VGRSRIRSAGTRAPLRIDLGDFCQKTYRLACLFARLLRRGSGCIVRLCTRCRSLKADENPAPGGTFFSGNRLKSPAAPTTTRETVNLRVPASTRGLIDRAAMKTGKTRNQLMLDASRRAAHGEIGLDPTAARSDRALNRPSVRRAGAQSARGHATPLERCRERNVRCASRPCSC
jgi:hypothetical protein